MNKKDIKIIGLSVFLIIGSYISFDLYTTFYAHKNTTVVPFSIPPHRAARFAIPSKLISPAKEILPRLTPKPLPTSKKIESLPLLTDAIAKDQKGLGRAISNLQSEPEYMQRLALVDEVLYRWAGVIKNNPNSRKSEDGINYIGDSRKLAFIEKMLNKPFKGTHTGTDVTTAPHEQSAPYILTSYNEMAKHTELLLLSLSPPRIKLYDSINLAFNRPLPYWRVQLKNTDSVIKDFYQTYGKLETIFWLEEIYASIDIIFDKEKPDPRKNIKRLTNIMPDINMKEFGQMITYGSSKADAIFASKENEIFFAMDYNDTIIGGKDDNIYLYKLYDGFDTIIEKGGQDTIYFSGHITPKDIKLDIDGNDVIITVKSDLRHGIRIKNFMCDPNNQVETIRFTKNRTVNLPLAIDNILKYNKQFTNKTLSNYTKTCPAAK